ncbi:TRAP transporter permease [Hwanghaeella sp. LZ110]|uniref:TRAP transporter permease n=1 Tax=Hwanghaeella sp. LZ110 TaxID=3402810 RepID=UPI003B680207
MIAAAIGAAFASIYIIFGLGNRLGLYVPLETQYFYFLLAALLPLVFLLFPAFGALEHRVPWWDWILAAVTLAVCAYFTFLSNDIVDIGWEYDAPVYAQILAFVLWGLVLEACRRAGGNAVFVVCLLASTYPMYSSIAPGFLSAPNISPMTTAGFHIFGSESILGIPMTALGTIVIGFLIFGVALQYTGGGEFFLNLAFSLLGRRRGGPAKVAIFASGLMGSMSGSVITNVMTTGVMTIPAMKRVGFRGSYAAGVEACASTGGVLMPPVMGTTAFVMATFLGIPYSDIVVAAIIPSLLFYLGLFLQIDAYSARNGLKGLEDAEVPKFGQVMREGWYFVFVFVLLIIMLVYFQRESQAPYVATALLLIINQFSKKHRWTWARLEAFVIGMGTLFAELTALLACVGLVIGSMMLTGKIGSLSYQLVAIAGDSVILLLVMGAITSFILGIGMTVTAAYLFLAVTLAPALTSNGLDPLAVHLFMLYWGMISFITPPVAIGAFAAASVARANPFRTGLEAMRLGSIIYFVPFFFVLNPALIGQGSFSEVATVFCSAVIGVGLISAGLQGHLFWIGTIKNSLLGWLARALLFLSGLAMALPGDTVVIALSNWEIIGFAAVLAILGVVASRFSRLEPQDLKLTVSKVSTIENSGR